RESSRDNLGTVSFEVSSQDNALGSCPLLLTFDGFLESFGLQHQNTAPLFPGPLHSISTRRRSPTDIFYGNEPTHKRVRSGMTTKPDSAAAKTVKQCCAQLYESDLAKRLIR